MATWKDEQIATEALNGVIKSKHVGSRHHLLLGMAVVAFSLLAGVYFLRKKVDVAQVSVSVEQKKEIGAVFSAGTATDVVKLSASAPATMTSKTPQLEVEASSGSPAVFRLSEKYALRQTAIVPSTVTASGLRPPIAALVNAREYLRMGDVPHALEQLAIKRLPLEAAEEQEAALLLARAKLASGNFEEAKKLFEALAFIPSNTAVGVDALMGNFWCQAGTLTRCRDSELDQVVNGDGPPSWGKALALMEQARRSEEKSGGNLEQQEEARALYQRALDTRSLEQVTEKDCVMKLTELTNRIVLDSKFACVSPKAIFHKVEAGDVLEKIAKRYKVNQGQLKQINHLGDKLAVRLGQVLKMLPGDVVYKVDRTHLYGTLYIDGVFIRRYPVGIGPGNATPVGIYNVSTKVANPDWYYDGKKIPFGNPENILGTRWMGFATPEGTGQGAGLGVHGTAFPESVPGRKSKGCVRMLNKDVEELFDLMPQGGKVEVIE